MNHNKKCNEKQARRNRNYTEPVLYPLRIYTINQIFFVNMYYLQPILLCRSNIAKQNFCRLVNVVSDGSPSRIRSVLLISFGMTTRPRSSIRRTIPVAFISESPLRFCLANNCKIIVRFWLCIIPHLPYRMKLESRKTKEYFDKCRGFDYNGSR